MWPVIPHFCEVEYKNIYLKLFTEEERKNKEEYLFKTEIKEFPKEEINV